MTWAEFKQAMEDAGVKDEYEIEYIDIDHPTLLSLRVELVEDGFTVSEGQ